MDQGSFSGSMISSSGSSSYNSSCTNLEIKIDSIMNQNYRTQLKPFKKTMERGFGSLNFDSMNHIKYYNKLPFKVLVDNTVPY